MKFPGAFFLSAACAAFAVPATAQLPDPVRALIEAAVATGDARKVDTVVDLAKQTNPGDAEEIEAIRQQFRADQHAAARLAEERRQEQIRNAGIFDRWKGKGELGGFRSTGNSDNLGISASLDLKREGIDWSHHFHATADYQETSGVKTRERYLAAYEPRYDIDDRVFAFGLLQFERDTFQGFDARYSSSLGLGYQVIKSKHVDLSVKAGPALRRTDFVNGGGETRLAGLFGYDFDWKIDDGLKLTQNSNLVADTASSGTIIIDSSTTTIALTTGLEAKITGKLSTRLSYQVNYDSNPPAGAESTDTISRVTLVYGF